MNIILQKNFHAVLFLVLLVLFFIYVFLPSLKKINTDFPNYYVSANMLLDGDDMKEVYDNVQFNKQVLLKGIENQFVSFIPYPPINALLMIPFARLEPLNAKLFWNILNLIFFTFSIYFISRLSGLNLFLTGIIFFLSGYAFVNNFFFGQAYLLVLLCLSASLYFYVNERDIPSSFFFAVSVVLKFYTFFFLIIFLFRKRYRLFLISVIFILGFNLLSFILTGWETNKFYYSFIMPRISDGWVGTGYAVEFQSFLSMVHILFFREPSLNPNPLIESPDLFYIFKYFYYSGLLAVSIFAAWYTRKNEETLKFHIAMFCFLSVLLLPVNASYQYVILVPAIAILVQYYSDEKKYIRIFVTIALFILMNSPLAIYLINLTKDTKYFFLGYIKLFILIYFWLHTVCILKKFISIKSFRNILINYSLTTSFIVLIFSRMSLSNFDYSGDGAKNVLNNKSYFISMPAVFSGKLVYVNCVNENFNLNSDFGFSYNKENIFEPEFLSEDKIVYETIESGKKVFKKLNIVNLQDSVISNTQGLRDSLKHSSLRCYSRDGQIFLDNGIKIIQLTTGNCFNTRPVLSEDNSKVIFCSDRNRGAGFTTLYEIDIKK